MFSFCSPPPLPVINDQSLRIEECLRGLRYKCQGFSPAHWGLVRLRQPKPAEFAYIKYSLNPGLNPSVWGAWHTLGGGKELTLRHSGVYILLASVLHRPIRMGGSRVFLTGSCVKPTQHLDFFSFLFVEWPGQVMHYYGC